MTEEIMHERFRADQTFANRPCAANNGFTKLGPCLDRIRPLLGPSLENRVRSALEEFVCKSNSHYAKRFPRLKKFLNTATAWTGCLDVSAKDTDIRQEMIKHAIEYLAKDGLVTQFADPVVLNRGPNKVDPDSLAAEQNRALKSMNVWRFINEKDYWLCQDCATCVDPETTVQIHHECKKVTSNSDLDVEVGSISQESSTFYGTCTTTSACRSISNRRVENPDTHANSNRRNFQLILESSATNPQTRELDNANNDSLKTLDLRVKFNCGGKFAQTQTSEGNLNFIFEVSQTSPNVADRSKPAPTGGHLKRSDDSDQTKFPQNSKIQIYVHRTTSTSRSCIRNPPNISNLSLPCKSSQLIVRLFEADPSLSDSCLVLMRKRFEKGIGNACSCMNDILKKLDEPLIKQLRLNCEIRPGRVDFNLSRKTDGTANRNKNRWFLGRVPTCSNVHKRDSRHELVERCEEDSNDRGSAKRLADFEEPRVASPASVLSARDSTEMQIFRNETNENEREERRREDANFARTRKGEKQVDFVLSSRTTDSQDEKDFVIPIQTDIERSEKCDDDVTAVDDEICEGEIDGSRGKEETIIGQCEAEETADVNGKSEARNDGFMVDDSENKLIELYDLKCGCCSDSLKGDGFGEHNSTAENNLEECSRRAFCTGDGMIEQNRSRTKNVDKKDSKDSKDSCHAFCTSGRTLMIEHSSHLDNKGSKVNHCHVICMNDRMVEHNLSRMKTVDDKNSKVDRPCRVFYTSDRVVERNSSRTRNLDDERSRIEHWPCYSKENTSKGQESTHLPEKKYDSMPEDYVSTGVSGLRTGERQLLENEERVFELKQGISQMKDTSKQEIHVFDIKVREKDILNVDERYSADSICVFDSNTEDSHDTKCSCCGEDIDGRNDTESNKPFICPGEKLSHSITTENAQAVNDNSNLRRSGFTVESNVSPTRDQFPDRFTTSEKNSIDLSRGCSADGERNSIGDTCDRKSTNESPPITESLFVFCERSNAKQFSSTDEASSSNENCRANRRESHGRFKSPCGGSVRAACRRKSIYSVTCDPYCATRDCSRVDRNVVGDRSRRQKEKDVPSVSTRCKNRSRRGSMVPGSLCGSFPAVDRIKYLIRKKLRKLLVEERDKGTSTSKTFLRNDRYLVSVSSGKLNDSRVTRESCTAGSTIRCPFTTRNRYEARGSPDRTFNEGSCSGKNKNNFGNIVRGRCQRTIRGNDVLKTIMIGDVSRPLGQKRDSKSTDTQDLMGDRVERAERSKRKGKKNVVDPRRCNKNRKSRNSSSVVPFNSRRMVFFEDDRDHTSRQKYDSKGRDRTKNPPADSKLTNYSRMDRYERALSRGSYVEYENGRGSIAEDVACRDKLRSFERRLLKLEKRRDEESNFAVLLSDYERRVNELDADFRHKLLQYVTLCRSVKNTLMKRLQPDDAYGVTSSSA
ncbi:uncharacterized protein LOC122531445 [Frieseomelitta varia]|nr:uncharacterized protein LOC122531445 [Frieseomelitta varia]